MSLSLVVLRPEPGCSETVTAARARGLNVIAAPLFTIEPVEWEVPDPGQFDGLLAGSANAFRCGGGGLASLTALPAHTVGERTAEAAREAGFAVASVGSGGLQAVLDELPTPCRLIRLAGEPRTSLVAPAGTVLTERVVYRAVPRRLLPNAIAALEQGALVLLHSGQAARVFAFECDRLALDRSKISLGVLAPRIAEQAGQGWGEVRLSPAVSDGALLELAAHMCQ